MCDDGPLVVSVVDAEGGTAARGRVTGDLDEREMCLLIVGRLAGTDAACAVTDRERVQFGAASDELGACLFRSLTYLASVFPEAAGFLA